MKQVIRVQTYDGKIFDSTAQAKIYLNEELENSLGKIVDHIFNKFTGMKAYQRLELLVFLYETLDEFVAIYEIKQDLISFTQLDDEQENK